MNALCQSGFVLGVMVCMAGCATRIPMNSVEIPSARPAGVIAKSRVAILPIAARVGGQRYLAPLSAANDLYLERVGPNLGIKAGRDVEKTFGEKVELTPAYKAILDKLLDRDPNLSLVKEDVKTTLDSKPWDGQSGIKYASLSDVNALAALKSAKPATTNVVAPDIRIQWDARVKQAAKYDPLPLASVRVLSQALECDYLLIPVVKDSYNYVKQWFAFGVIPLFRATGVYRMNDTAFYLVDGTTGEVVKALQISEDKLPGAASNESLFMVLALNKVLQKGDAFGSLEFK